MWSTNCVGDRAPTGYLILSARTLPRRPNNSDKTNRRKCSGRAWRRRPIEVLHFIWYDTHTHTHKKQYCQFNKVYFLETERLIVSQHRQFNWWEVYRTNGFKRHVHCCQRCHKRNARFGLNVSRIRMTGHRMLRGANHPLIIYKIYQKFIKIDS